MSTVSIVGYEQEGHCEHCGRTLKHCIRISDGRLVGATCFDKKLTLPRRYQGKTYRVGSENVIKFAKVVQFYGPSSWGRFGVTAQSLIFETA